VSHLFSIRSFGLIVLMLISIGADASGILVTVRDQAGAPVKDVVVVARALAGKDTVDEPQAAVMDQINRQFAPFVIAVRTGSSVLFENSDSVAHQVYSFSPPRPFELGLYRGKPRSPIVFEKTGIVVLGCNIHDNMIGYVYVTDAPHFGTTNASGEWRSRDLPVGDYAIEIWTPRASARERTLKRTATIASTLTPVGFQFEHTLEPAPAPVRELRLRDY
jgi:plastocyanin